MPQQPPYIYSEYICMCRTDDLESIVHLAGSRPALDSSSSPPASLFSPDLFRSLNSICCFSFKHPHMGRKANLVRENQFASFRLRSDFAVLAMFPVQTLSHRKKKKKKKKKKRTEGERDINVHVLRRTQPGPTCVHALFNGGLPTHHQ